MTTKPAEPLIQDWIRSFELDMKQHGHDVSARYQYSNARYKLQEVLAEWREVSFPIIRQHLKDIFPDGNIPPVEYQKSVFIGWLWFISGFVKTDTGLSIRSPYNYNICGLLCWNGFIRKDPEALKLEVKHRSS